MSNRVYVGNLSWSTSWQDLKDHMRDVGDVQYAKVLQDRDGRSKGCGIVEFTTVEGAADAIEKLTDTELKGRKIFVREDREDGKKGGDRPPRTEGGDRPPRTEGGDKSEKGEASEGAPAPSGGGGGGGDKAAPVPGSQLFIGNLSWETGWQDLKDHFRTIGEVERADVAVGRDGRKKGFGFIRFATAEEATKAIEELNGVEFMGRPIEVRLDNKA
jgi:RNA recognition motif-containing protein